MQISQFLSEVASNLPSLVVAFAVGGPILMFATRKMDRGGFGSRKGIGYAYGTLAIAYGVGLALSVAVGLLVVVILGSGGGAGSAGAAILLLLAGWAGQIVVWMVTLVKRYRLDLTIAVGISIVLGLGVFVAQHAITPLFEPAPPPPEDWQAMLAEIEQKRRDNLIIPHPEAENCCALIEKHEGVIGAGIVETPPGLAHHIWMVAVAGDGTTTEQARKHASAFVRIVGKVSSRDKLLELAANSSDDFEVKVITEDEKWLAGGNVRVEKGELTVEFLDEPPKDEY